ncbi:NADP-dependent oxidoreductase [Luteibacter aegosomaticola]|uniref:NADP-dependent oxidoreductase n=1 Tax=Luteibacter aegosomaticola TaxID=2911538 RepID=UPI001FF75B00|nr:NADP-dependent oxidoreductase [Luteibacter aegosomaticola]UPG90001.1 NADP-dependent oxidoreductase [Luteibacter aegosomaticola]
MKATQIQTYGGPETVTVTDIEPPMPAPGEVVISIKAAALNPLDLKIIAGYMQQVFPIDLPYTPGSDFSGIVQAVGEGVTEVNVGDRVFGRTAPTAGGALAEQVRLPATDVRRIPPEMSFEQAASLPTTYGTAKQALTDVAKLQHGERVLIHGGAGGVGTMAVQIAALAGAHIIATASERNHALVRELGAHEVLDYRLDDFTRLENIDVVLDTFGGETLEKSWSVLGPKGRIATLADFSIKARDGHEGSAVFFSTATPYLADAIAQFQRGKLQVITDAIFDLADARAALEKLATGHARGKIIVRIGG